MEIPGEYHMTDDEDPDWEDDEGRESSEDAQGLFDADEMLRVVPSDEDDDELIFEGEEAEDDSDRDGEEFVVELEPGATLSDAQRLMAMTYIQRLFGNRHGFAVDNATTVSSRQGRPRRQTMARDRLSHTPSEMGTDLMCRGLFGTSDLGLSQKKASARRVLDRELGLGGAVDRLRNDRLLVQELIPTSRAETIIHHEERVYSGQFSEDGSFFFSCCQDFKVRMYDTSNPYNWNLYKTTVYPWNGWTLTDASLSPDNRWLAYSSLTPWVGLATTDPNDKGVPYSLDFGDQGTHSGRRGGGIFSVRFSGDGRELVAGTNSYCILVYDIESRTVLHSVRGHQDDVNAVCFADKQSPHVLYSGSDDRTIKVWDRRSMADRRPAGAFVGHLEGITYIDSKGDGRYVLSNGKDQTMKLWDLRGAMTTQQFSECGASRPIRSNFDYRMGGYEDDDWEPHPHDNSVVTFRGHSVLRTLIRCHFSPPGSSDSRFVYSGSQDGKVYIWNLDGALAGEIDVLEATRNSKPRQGRTLRFHNDPNNAWSTCVRDASWHPSAPIIAASAWNGYENEGYWGSPDQGTCSIHAFNESSEDEAEPFVGRNVNEALTGLTSNQTWGF